MVTVTANHTAKYSKVHNKHTPLILALIIKALPNLCKEFDIPSNLEIIVKPLKARTTIGQACYNNGKNLTVEIDCRLNHKELILETVAHELVHIEQYHQKRLVPKLQGGCYYNMWNDGDRVCQHKQRPPRINFQAYLDAPWEVEARKRAAEWMEKYNKSL